MEISRRSMLVNVRLLPFQRSPPLATMKPKLQPPRSPRSANAKHIIAGVVLLARRGRKARPLQSSDKPQGFRLGPCQHTRDIVVHQGPRHRATANSRKHREKCFQRNCQSAPCGVEGCGIALQTPTAGADFKRACTALDGHVVNMSAILAKLFGCRTATSHVAIALTCTLPFE